MSAWLGHADPAFTPPTYLHLMDDGPGDASFLDDVFSNAAVACRDGASEEATL